MLLCRNFISTSISGNEIPTIWRGNEISTNHPSELYTIHNPAAGWVVGWGKAEKKANLSQLELELGNNDEQAGDELGQTQLKLGLDFTLLNLLHR